LTPDRVEPRVEELPALTTNVLLTVDEAELFQPRARDPRENQAPLIRLTLLAHGVPKDLGVSYMKSEHTWQWPDGVTVKRSSGYADYGNDAFANSERALGTALGLVPEKVNPDYLKWVNAWSKARGLLPLKFRTEAGDELPIETIEPLTPSIAARMLQEPPVYSAVGVLALIKPEVQLELPLLDRDRHRFGANSLRITDTVVEDGKEHIALVESRATSWLDGLSSLFPLSFKPSRDRHQFVLVNHARGNLSSFHSDDWGSKERTRVGTVEIAWRGARFSAPRDWLGDGKWKDQENWFEGVTLAETTAHEVARFSREVKVAKLEVKPPVEANEDRR